MEINGPSHCKTPDDQLNEKSEFEIYANTFGTRKDYLWEREKKLETLTTLIQGQRINQAVAGGVYMCRIHSVFLKFSMNIYWLPFFPWWTCLSLSMDKIWGARTFL